MKKPRYIITILSDEAVLKANDKDIRDWIIASRNRFFGTKGPTEIKANAYSFCLGTLVNPDYEFLLPHAK